MSKFCPVIKHKVTYLDCQECDDKVCERPEKHIAILVVGSRNYNNYKEFCNVLDYLLSHYYPENVTLISGGAKGADSLAEQYAKSRGIDIIVMKADWNAYGKKAGYIRNEAMHKALSEYSNRHVIAFWDEESKGTAHSFLLAKKYQNPISCYSTVKQHFIRVKCRDEK